MRPIDADKVKAESREHCKTCIINGTKHCKTCVVNLICERMDLQPTVEPQRQQGEWIDHSEDYGYAECPFCHELTNCEGNIDELHFCWKCGAKLRKGGAK